MEGMQSHPVHIDNRPTIYQQIEGLKTDILDLKRCLKASNEEIDKLRADINAQNQAIVNFVRVCSAPAAPVPEMPKAESKTYTPSEAKRILKAAGITIYPGEIQSFLVRNGWAKLMGTNISPTPKGDAEGIVAPREGTKWVNITEKGLSILKEHYMEVMT